MDIAAMKYKLSILSFLLFAAIPTVSLAIEQKPACAGGYAVLEGAYYADTDRIQLEMGNGFHYFTRNTKHDSGAYQAYLYDAKDVTKGYDNFYIVYSNTSNRKKAYIDVINMDTTTKIETVLCASEFTMGVGNTDPSKTGKENLDTAPNMSATTTPTDEAKAAEAAKLNIAGIPVPNPAPDTGQCPAGSDVFTSGMLKGVPCAGTVDSLEEILIIIKNLVMGFIMPAVGTIFTILMIIGGIMYITSRGNEKQIAKAKQTLTAAIIGLLIVVLSYTLVAIFTGLLGGSIS